MKRTKEELLSDINAVLGENNTTDEAIALLENVADSFDEKPVDETDWKAKYEENDKAWRTRYTERFMNGAAKDDVIDEPNINDIDEPSKYEDLFKIKEA